MTQIDFSVIGTSNNHNAINLIDQAKLEDSVFKHHVGSILNARLTPNNQAQPIATWRKIQESIQAVASRSRLKIPVLYGIDAIHGATYTQNATLFPQALSMAATFNPDLSLKRRDYRAGNSRFRFAMEFFASWISAVSRFGRDYGKHTAKMCI